MRVCEVAVLCLVGVASALLPSLFLSAILLRAPGSEHRRSAARATCAPGHLHMRRPTLQSQVDGRDRALPENRPQPPGSALVRTGSNQ
jgi:hypothetical protein